MSDATPLPDIVERLRHWQELLNHHTVPGSLMDFITLRDAADALDAIRCAAKMPADYQHGLPAWITELLVRAESAACPRTEDVQEIERLRAALTTPEIYAGVITEVLERERGELVHEVERLRAELVKLRSDLAKVQISHNAALHNRSE